ncbi:hypothetical protein BOH78_3379 [Pichia kudriavzevii]|uniref:Uncharacterized protein n=1 Tax=Pichia kudriavzevii TaxID=4909 RepID=A0A1V2LKN0_PICKU|nr:hypothetical protein BOH78_3379 [Pichia kudriavzevii]
MAIIKQQQGQCCVFKSKNGRLKVSLRRNELDRGYKLISKLLFSNINDDTNIKKNSTIDDQWIELNGKPQRVKGRGNKNNNGKIELPVDYWGETMANIKVIVMALTGSNV